MQNQKQPINNHSSQNVPKENVDNTHNNNNHNDNNNTDLQLLDHDFILINTIPSSTFHHSNQNNNLIENNLIENNKQQQQTNEKQEMLLTNILPIKSLFNNNHHHHGHGHGHNKGHHIIMKRKKKKRELNCMNLVILLLLYNNNNNTSLTTNNNSTPSSITTTTTSSPSTNNNSNTNNNNEISTTTNNNPTTTIEENNNKPINNNHHKDNEQNNKEEEEDEKEEEEEISPYITYEISSDHTTLAFVALKNNMDIDEVLNLNPNLSSYDTLEFGQKVKIRNPLYYDYLQKRKERREKCNKHLELRDQIGEVELESLRKELTSPNSNSPNSNNSNTNNNNTNLNNKNITGNISHVSREEGENVKHRSTLENTITPRGRAKSEIIQLPNFLREMIGQTNIFPNKHSSPSSSSNNHNTTSNNNSPSSNNTTSIQQNTTTSGNHSPNIITTPFTHHHSLYAQRQHLKIPKITNGYKSSFLKEEIHFKLLNISFPLRFKNKNLNLLYSTHDHGYSLLTLYRKIEGFNPIIVFIETTKKEIFGCFISNEVSFTKYDKYYGEGECFIFRYLDIDMEMKNHFLKKENELCGDDEEDFVFLQKEEIEGHHVTTNVEHHDTHHVTNHATHHKLLQENEENHTTIQVYKWTKKNNYFISTTIKHFAVGGGGDGYSFQIDGDLRFGTTHRSDTFDNELLCGECDFEILNVEVYTFEEFGGSSFGNVLSVAGSGYGHGGASSSVKTPTTTSSYAFKEKVGESNLY
ncbi:hypothetical protein ABK040_008680 [Willaertia magna]